MTPIQREDRPPHSVTRDCNSFWVAVAGEGQSDTAITERGRATLSGEFLSSRGFAYRHRSTLGAAFDETENPIPNFEVNPNLGVGMTKEQRLRGEIAIFLDTWDRCWSEMTEAHDRELAAGVKRLRVVLGEPDEPD